MPCVIGAGVNTFPARYFSPFIFIFPTHVRKYVLAFTKTEKKFMNIVFSRGRRGGGREERPEEEGEGSDKKLKKENVYK